MRRINTSTRAVNLFGAGKDGFKDGNLGLGVAPTDFNAEWPNGVQEEILSVIEGAGITPSNADLTQLRQAINILIDAKEIGVGRTWQNVTGSKAINTTFTNTSGKTIFVAATVKGAVASSTVAVSWTVGGVPNIDANDSITGAVPANTALSAFAAVPHLGTYRLEVTQGTLFAWLQFQ